MNTMFQHFNRQRPNPKKTTSITIPAKRTLAKSRKSSSETVAKKRATRKQSDACDASDRATKRQKTERPDEPVAEKEGGQEVTRKGAGEDKQRPICIDDSDTEDDIPLINRMRAQPKQSVDILEPPVKEEGPVPSLSSTTTLGFTSPKARDVEFFSVPNALRVADLEAEIALLKSRHAEAVERLAQDLEAERQKSSKLQSESSESNVKIVELEAKVQSKEFKEQEGISQLFEAQEENADLKRTLEAKTAAYDDLHGQFTTLKHTETNLKTEITNLNHEIDAIDQHLMREKEDHRSLIHTLTTTHTQLAADLTTATHARILAEQHLKDLQTLSPAPSLPLSHSDSPTTASDSSQRHAKVLRTYTRVKTRYDSLFSIAQNLAGATRGMNLGNFGEFGAYLRQLRGAVDEQEKEQGVQEAGTLERMVEVERPVEVEERE
ncbi:hypothetical protein BDV95DRAFT_596829 [Massariosphaeria phaeospora]|uniref:Uncharacterized protein n=1 Tax=Massariosphaeria phaeospora TaxID=100035 RepID=A0A7C8I680_9PLEO|nr:hypothetical protein BDV95DRAFT_596829 [Massariosphaeria phaeospora]